MADAEIFAGFYFAQDVIVQTYQRGRYGDVAPVTKDEPSPEGWEANLSYAADVIAHLAETGDIHSIGLAVPSAFRIRLDENDPDYGFLGASMGPKRWQNVNVKTELLKRLKKRGVTYDPRIKIISQVGATSWGDFVNRYSDAFGPNASAPDRRNLPNILYIVADAGIGASLITKGDLFHGQAVPTIGHTIVHVEPEILREDNSLPAPCKYHPHRPCLNSVASLDAIKAKWGLEPKAYHASNDKNMVSQLAFYLAQAITTHAYMLSPEKVVLSGRVAEHPLFVAELKDWLVEMREELLHGFEASYQAIHHIDDFIEEPIPDAGVRGAVKTVSVPSSVTSIVDVSQKDTKNA